MPNTIQVDLDGVLCRFEDYAIERFGPGNRTFFRLEDRWPDKNIEIQKLICSPRTYLHLKPIPEIIRAVRNYDIVGDVVVVTSRPTLRSIRCITRWWLNKHVTPYSRIIFAGEFSKTDIAKEIGAGLVFEDNPVDLLELQAANIPTITIDWPYNQNVPGARILLL